MREKLAPERGIPAGGAYPPLQWVPRRLKGPKCIVKEKWERGKMENPTVLVSFVVPPSGGLAQSKAAKNRLKAALQTGPVSGHRGVRAETGHHGWFKDLVFRGQASRPQRCGEMRRLEKMARLPQSLPPVHSTEIGI